jgi:hypothetical protein
MDRPRIFPGLRIAWTAAFGILCVLLIALWVRSYDRLDNVTWVYDPPHAVRIFSWPGSVCVVLLYNVDPSEPIFGCTIGVDTIEWYTNYRIATASTKNAFGVHLPYWMLLLGCSTIGGVPIVKWRFSVRSLLIATGVTSVVPGLVMWSIC